MTLTEEQKRNIERNRQKALEIRRRKAEEANNATKRTKPNPPSGEIEEFEIDLPSTVTKTEAMSVYCLPKGTLDVCSFIEKPNPKQAKFVPMKLYDRNEIRRRAHERFGGVEGLKKERKRREDKRLEKDLDVANTFFSGK